MVRFKGYIVRWTNIDLNTNFGIGPQEINSTTYTPAPFANVISEIDLPNGQKKYSFHYEANYGLLNEIDLPDGGIVSYTYTNYVDTSDLYNTGTRRYVTQRTETVGGVASSWHINIPNNQGNNVSEDEYRHVPDSASHQAVVAAMIPPLTRATSSRDRWQAAGLQAQAEACNGSVHERNARC